MSGVRAPEGPLGTSARTVAQGRRRARYQRRDALREIQPPKLERVGACGHGAAQGAGVAVRATFSPEGTIAGFAGVETCGSVWACPVCSVTIMSRRQDELARGLEQHTKRGGYVAMLTLTMRHTAGDQLEALWDGLSDAWRYLVQSRDWRRWFSGYWSVRGGQDVWNEPRTSSEGYVRVTEVTHGENGWHVHLHVLLLLHRKPTKDQLEASGAQLFARWRKGLQRKGFGSWDAVQDYKLIVKRPKEIAEEVSAYVCKAAAFEATRSDLKVAKTGNRTPWGIADDILKRQGGELLDGDDPELFLELLARDVSLWRVYAKGSAGRRAMIWSRGLRDRLGLEEEKTDEEVAAEELGGDVLAFIDQGRKLLRDPALACTVLEAVEECENGEAAYLAVWLLLTPLGFSVARDKPEKT